MILWFHEPLVSVSSLTIPCVLFVEKEKVNTKEKQNFPKKQHTEQSSIFMNMELQA